MTVKDTMKTLCCVVGARPNFMKIAPILRALKLYENDISPILVHTGQHYDADMNDTFFEQLEIKKPEVHLGVGSASHAVQTAEIMKKFEPVIEQYQPDAVLVVGDVNSTIACALVSSKLGVRVIHVEAGLRSNDRSMPEEINRILTDQLSDLLFTTEKSAQGNLTKEGISADKVFFTGNVMIDTLFHHLDRAPTSESLLQKFGIRQSQRYGLVTLHRPSNVDQPEKLAHVVDTLIEVSEHVDLVFPVHPRTAVKLQNANLMDKLKASGITVTEPMGYLDLLGIMRDSSVVLTDSGGIQEETTALGIPCVTLRENTERPITLKEGTNVLVGTDREKILAAVKEALRTTNEKKSIPELWDGKAAERIASVLKGWL